MPMNATVLANLIDSKMPPLPTEQARQERLKGLQAIAEAVVEHISEFAQVNGIPALLAPPGVSGGPLLAPPGPEAPAFPPGSIS